MPYISNWLFISFFGLDWKRRLIPNWRLNSFLYTSIIWLTFLRNFSFSFFWIPIISLHSSALRLPRILVISFLSKLCGTWNSKIPLSQTPQLTSVPFPLTMLKYMFLINHYLHFKQLSPYVHRLIGEGLGFPPHL